MGGYNLVFDVAATTVNQTPMVMYTTLTGTDADLSDLVLKQLNANAPAEGAKAPETRPPTTSRRRRNSHGKGPSSRNGAPPSWRARVHGPSAPKSPSKLSRAQDADVGPRRRPSRSAGSVRFEPLQQLRRGFGLEDHLDLQIGELRDVGRAAPASRHPPPGTACSRGPTSRIRRVTASWRALRRRWSPASWDACS